MSEILSNNKRMAKNTILLTIRMVFVTLVYIYTSRIILNTLGVIDYGIYNVVGGFVSMFGFLNLSLANGIQRYYNFEKGARGKDAITPVYNTALLIQGVLALIVLVLLESIGIWYLYSKMVIPSERFNIAFWLFQFSVITSSITIFQIPFQAAIMSYEKMDFYALVSVLDVLINLVIVIVIPYVWADKLLIFGFLTMIRSFISFAMYSIYCKKKFPELMIQWKVNGKLLKQMLTFSGWNVIGSFGAVIKDQGMNIILNLFFGPAVNAAKGIANQVSGAVQGFVANISVAVRPQLTGSYASGDRDRAYLMMFSLFKVSFVVQYLISLPLMIELNYVLKLWLGDSLPENTNSFIIITIILNFLAGFSSSFSSVVHSAGNLKWYQITGAICNIAVLPLSFIYLDKGGDAVTAYSLTIGFVLINLVITLLLLNKNEGISIIRFFKTVLLPLLIVVVTTVFFPMIPFYCMKGGILRLCVVILVSFFVILSSYYMFGTNKFEKEIIRLMIRSNKATKKI